MASDILQDIENWFERIVKDFPQVRFRYEFDQSYGTYKIAYYINEELSNNNDFYGAVLLFEDCMNDAYGNFAPLFCQNEELFKLSDSASIFPIANN